jgi:hypothetical protein
MKENTILKILGNHFLVFKVSENYKAIMQRDIRI